MKIDLSLSNNVLYAGCEISEVGGRPTLVTSPADAINIVGRNARDIVSQVPASERGEIELSGPTAVWSYLIVFHQVVHAFSQVWYNDGRNPRVLISQH